jgi:hypothetical protein
MLPKLTVLQGIARGTGRKIHLFPILRASAVPLQGRKSKKSFFFFGVFARISGGIPMRFAHCGPNTFPLSRE